MKITLIVTLFFLASLPCFASLTQEDVMLIRQIIREEIEPLKKEIESLKKDIVSVRMEMAMMKGEIQALKATIAEMDKRMAAQLAEMDKRVAAQFNAVYRNFSLIQWFIGGLIAITVAAIALPRLLIAYRERKENRLSKKVDKHN
ncbi:TPA: hypothetical protein EYP66_21380 [Candidatus Poribacteria bacterium]|nr:hypothetical protein [Candidatus Poribacteria bacterium]